MTLDCSLAVVVPALNEEDHIGRCVLSLLAQLPEDGRIYVVDGGSLDKTREIVDDLKRQDPRIVLLFNRYRLQSAAVNQVAQLLATHPEPVELLIRADAHAAYPPDFIELLVEAYRASGAQSVVVPMTTVGEREFQRAVAAAQNSLLGNGGSAHRRATASRFVDHGHHALFNLSFFRKVGGYDETFSHNEDFELDHRIQLAGGQIWMCAEAVVEYVPRATPGALAQQYYRHGFGRGRTIAKHRLSPKLRQLLPVMALASCVLGLAAAPVFWQAALIPAMYIASCMAWGIVLSIRYQDKDILSSGFAAVIMHLSWALGLIHSIMRAPVIREQLANAQAHRRNWSK